MENPITARAAITQVLLSGPLCGVEIIATVARQTRGLIVLRQGSVYPALTQLEKSGMVVLASTEVDRRRGGRPKKLYRLTRRGIALGKRRACALAAFFSHWIES